MQAVEIRKSDTRPVIYCGIYCRTSTDDRLDSDFNSLDAQELCCTKHIDMHKHEGLVLRGVYIDAGISGGTKFTHKRPDLNKLLSDIKGRLINMVIVYKVERFARSLRGFIELYDVLREYNVAFVSVSERFDTSTPLGEAFLQLIVVFAELELKNGRIRTLDKIAASKEKGMWMGGIVPLGYKAEEKKLIVSEDEAETVRFIFSQFLKEKSIMKLAHSLREKGVKNKNAKVIGFFTASSLRALLNNPIYIGKVGHKGAVYEGQHKAIISSEIWQASRRLFNLDPKARAGITKRKIPFILTGLLKCGCCNSGMTPSYTKKKHGKLYRYYVSNAHVKAKCVDCQVKQISAPEIESLVFDQLHQVFQTPEVLVETWKQANQADQPGPDSRCGTISEEQVRDALVNISSIWDNLFPAEQQRVVSLMVDKVVMQPDKIQLQIKNDGLLYLAQTRIEDSNNDRNRDTISN
jgi:site-specific DNA recombinase